MKSGWHWREGAVPRDEDHLELRCRLNATSDAERMVSTALVGKPTDRMFSVEWMVDSGPENAQAREAVQRELDFYLLERFFLEPWEYALYHCTTAANLHSKVHRSYFPGGVHT
jgi:hypothetical protein